MLLNPQQQKVLWSYSKADPKWRIENFYKIINKDGKLVNFKLNKAQAEFIDELTEVSEFDSAKDLLLKARQLGFTTLLVIFGLDQCIWNPYFTAEFISIDELTMKKTFEKVRIAWMNFPLRDLFQIRGQISQTELHFGHESVIRCAMKSRGGTVQFLHVSELGKISRENPIKADEILTGAFPAVPPGGRIIVESTAEGEGNLLHRLWNGAVRGDNGFKNHFFPWFYDERYFLPCNDFEITKDEQILKDQVKSRYDYDLSDEQIMFIRTKRQLLGDKCDQEFPTFPEHAFLSTGRKVFDARMIKIACKEQEPVEGHIYAIGCDVADLGEDKSILKVLDCNTGEIVYNFAEDLPVERFSKKCLEIGYKYNTGKLIWESNGMGVAMRALILQADYPNFYTTVRKDKITEKYTEVVGFHMGRNKHEIISELDKALRNEYISLSDPEDLIELRAFEYKPNGKLEAPSGEHDDRVMALALANYAALDMPIGEAATQLTPIQEKLAEIARKNRSKFNDII